VGDERVEFLLGEQKFTCCADTFYYWGNEILAKQISLCA